jgi:hypothetical protein
MDEYRWLKTALKYRHSGRRVTATLKGSEALPGINMVN